MWSIENGLLRGLEEGRKLDRRLHREDAVLGTQRPHGGEELGRPVRADGRQRWGRGWGRGVSSGDEGVPETVGVTATQQRGCARRR